MTFEDYECLKVGRDSAWAMLEPRAYFEAYRPVMEALSHKRSLPLSKHILQACFKVPTLEPSPECIRHFLRWCLGLCPAKM